MAQSRSEARSTRKGKNDLNQREYPDKQSSASRKREGSSLGNLARRIADRPGILLAAASAAAAAAGTLLMSRWFGENGWLGRSVGRGVDDESFPQASSADDLNEVPAFEPDQHTRLKSASLDGVNPEARFEGANASQREAVAQIGRQNQGSAPLDRGDGQA